MFVVRNLTNSIQEILSDATKIILSITDNYELIIIDNSSDDESISILKKLTAEDGEPNLQIYALTKEVDFDTAACVGIENALGDFIVICDPCADDISFLPEMVKKITNGFDVVFANNEKKSKNSFFYCVCFTIFNKLYRLFHCIDLLKDAPRYRALSRNVVNFILRHSLFMLAYRHLPATGGFVKINLNYSSAPKYRHKKRLWENIDRGMQLLISSTRMPMRIVTTLSLFGAIANFVYSVYILVIAFIKVNIAPGWISLSLQQSGMFFLISLVLLVLGEYILNMASLSNDSPRYHIGQEFSSVRMTHYEKLNVVEATSTSPLSSLL